MAGSSGGFNRYPVIDVRHLTSPGVTGSRRNNPVGACIHHTGGTDSLAWLTGSSEQAGSPVSTDVLIKRAGNRYRICPDGRYAYHAGTVATTITRLFASGNINEKLLGVELEYVGPEGPSYEQIDSTAEQLVQWALQWGWRWPLIIYAHSGIAAPMGRKPDPYLLDWGSLMGRVYVMALAADLPGLR